MTHNNKPEPYSSFFVDYNDYTERDRLMFVCGIEYETIYRTLRADKPVVGYPVHRENIPRIIRLCESLGKKYNFKQADRDWSHLTVSAKAAP